MKIGVFHNYLYDKLKKRYGNEYDRKIIIKRKELRNFLGWFNIPLRLQTKFIKELEELGMIKVKDKQGVVLKKKKPNDWFE